MSNKNKALFALLIWFLLASAFNALSMLDVSRGLASWTVSNPFVAQVFVVAFAAAFLLALRVKSRPLSIMLLSTVTTLLFLGGVSTHLLSAASNYVSAEAHFCAIAINVFGVAAFSFGLYTIAKKNN